MFKLMITTVSFLAAVLIPSAYALGAEQDTSTDAKPTYSLDGIRGFVRDVELDGIRKAVQGWQSGPLYLKPGLVKALMEYLTSDEKCETRNYLWEKGTHDLNRASGRAAWALEGVVGIELTKIKPTSSKKELQAVRKQAENMAKGYEAGIMAAAAEFKPGKSTDELTAAYKDKIRHGIHSKDYEKSYKLMSKLFAEWFPLGKNLSELEEIMGSSGMRREGRVYVDYDFQTGWGGILYRLTIHDGMIVSVSILGID